MMHHPQRPSIFVQRFTSRFGFTLVEIILASSIFAVVGLIAITVFVNVIRIQQRVNLENAIYEDARFMMERIAREIRRNTVDYEEYYNKLVENQPYGHNFGCYASRFYHPGSAGFGVGTGDFGALCNDGTPATPNCVIDKTTLDINTGTNPFEGNIFHVPFDPNQADAFCDQQFGGSVSSCGNLSESLQPELYLIDSRGTEKTIFALKNITSNPSDFVLAMLRLDGEDNDKDGIRESWTRSTCVNRTYCCAPGFSCPANPLDAFTASGNIGPLEVSQTYQNGTLTYVGFVPISPSRTSIKSLRFLIAPLEDPRKAFGEDSGNIQQQPHVTVVMTVEPASSALKNYQGARPSITLQTTITSRVFNEVKSFSGAGICSSGY